MFTETFTLANEWYLPKQKQASALKDMLERHEEKATLLLLSLSEKV